MIGSIVRLGDDSPFPGKIGVVVDVLGCAADPHYVVVGRVGGERITWSARLGRAQIAEVLSVLTLDIAARAARYDRIIAARRALLGAPAGGPVVISDARAQWDATLEAIYEWAKESPP